MDEPLSPHMQALLKRRRLQEKAEQEDPNYLRIPNHIKSRYPQALKGREYYKSGTEKLVWEEEEFGE